MTPMQTTCTGPEQTVCVQNKTRAAKVEFQEVHKKLRIITGSLAGTMHRNAGAARVWVDSVIEPNE